MRVLQQVRQQVQVQVQVQAAPPPRGQRVAWWPQRVAAVLRAFEPVKLVRRARRAPWRPMPCCVQRLQQLVVWRVGLAEPRVPVGLQPP